jgi:hypothetical protein
MRSRVDVAGRVSPTTSTGSGGAAAAVPVEPVEVVTHRLLVERRRRAPGAYVRQPARRIRVRIVGEHQLAVDETSSNFVSAMMIPCFAAHAAPVL